MSLIREPFKKASFSFSSHTLVSRPVSFESFSAPFWRLIGVFLLRKPSSSSSIPKVSSIHTISGFLTKASVLPGKGSRTAFLSSSPVKSIFSVFLLRCSSITFSTLTVTPNTLLAKSAMVFLLSSLLVSLSETRVALVPTHIISGLPALSLKRLTRRAMSAPCLPL